MTNDEAASRFTQVSLSAAAAAVAALIVLAVLSLFGQADRWMWVAWLGLPGMSVTVGALAAAYWAAGAPATKTATGVDAQAQS